MINLLSLFTTSNIINLVLGIAFGFFIMIIISCAIISKMLSKQNENENIRLISNQTYNNYFLNKDNIKDKIINSLIYEIKNVSLSIYPEKENPLYELSINDLLNAITIIQKKLKHITNHPLFIDIKHIHISKMLSFEENITRPIFKVYNNKKTQFVMNSYRVLKMIINIFNPIFYIKKITTHFLIKKGKKDMILILLDFIGNNTYQIYISSKKQND